MPEAETVQPRHGAAELGAKELGRGRTWLRPVIGNQLAGARKPC